MAYQVTAGRFVARTQELTRLRELLARAAAGEPLVALIAGEAGVGKTRLAEQLAATATQQGIRVLGGGCVPLGEEGLPLAPVTQALGGLADLDAAELAAVAGPARAELGRLLPDLARLVPDLARGGEAASVAGVAGVAGAGQGRLFELLLGVVQRLAATAPLLWVMEDLHWADRSTRDLLAYLATVPPVRAGAGGGHLPQRRAGPPPPAAPAAGGAGPQPPRAAAGAGAASPAPSWPSSWPACSAPTRPPAWSTTSTPVRRATRSSPRSCCWPAPARIRGCCRPASRRCS